MSAVRVPISAVGPHPIHLRKLRRADGQCKRGLDFASGERL